MKLPMDLILERMKYLHPEVRLKNPATWLQGIKLLPSCPYAASDEYLYLCEADAPALAGCTVPVAIRCGTNPSPVPTDNCILLHTEVPLNDIFNELLGLQLLLQDWDLRLNLSVSEGQGVQHLLDLSEPVLGNPIVINDPACKCLACTSSFDTDDPLFSQWIGQGYLSAENFRHLKESEAFMQDEIYSGETVILPTSPVKPYVTTFTPVLNEDRTQVRYEISMQFSNIPYSPGMFQLYLHLVDKMMIYLRRSVPDRSSHKKQFDYFIIDLLDGNYADQRELQERARCFPEPSALLCNVVVIWQAHNSDMYRKHALFTLRTLFPNMEPVIYRGYILLLSDLGDPRQGLTSGSAERLESLERFLEAEDAYAGISNRASGYPAIAHAFHREARLALTLGQQLRNRNPGKKRTFWYADYHLYHILSAAQTHMQPQEMANSLLLDLVQYDQSHNTDYRNVLCTYLSCERSFTKAAQLLHLHRNTIIYQIHRIEELFHLNLDDGELRLQLLLTDRVLQLYPECLHQPPPP